MSSHKKNAVSALQPKNMSSPFGSISNTKHSTSYQPNYFDGQQDILNTAPRNEANLLQFDLPHATSQYSNMLGNYLGRANDLTAGNLVNPEIYNAMYGLHSRPLLDQYHLDVNNLNDELASKNLTGGSYDALAHGKLNQNLGTNLGNAADQAVMSGLQGTQTYLGMLGDATQSASMAPQILGNLAGNYQTMHTGLEQELMDPMHAYTQYQQTINPLQLQKAQYDYSTPTGFQNAMGAYGGMLNAVVPGAGAGFVALGNGFGNPGAANQYSYGGTGNSFMGTLGEFFGGKGGGSGASVLGSGASGGPGQGWA